MKIYLVRHGESEGNLSNIHQGESSPLSFEGMRQADRLAARFEGVQIDKIIASPFMRTKQTAEAIAKETGIEIEFDSRAKELIRPSVVIGRSAREPEIRKIWDTIYSHRHEPGYRYSDEENFFDFKKRLMSFIRDLEKRPEEDLIVVSHGYAIRAMIGIMLFGDEFSSSEFFALLEHTGVSNTGITICNFQTDRGWRLSVFNDAAHLLD